MDEYKTVLGYGCAEFIERRSKFIGYAKPVTTEEEAVAFINEIKSKHWDATHNVYAYCLQNGRKQRYSDDGEPQGTAGVPTLEALLKSGVTDAVVVVTRYFGGILLGAGGLVRAYSYSAKIALEAAKVITMQKCIIASFDCTYTQYGKASAIIPAMGGIIDDTQFTDNVEITFHIVEDKLAALDKQMAEITCGKAQIKEIATDYFSLNRQA